MKSLMKAAVRAAGVADSRDEEKSVHSAFANR